VAQLDKDIVKFLPESIRFDLFVTFRSRGHELQEITNYELIDINDFPSQLGQRELTALPATAASPNVFATSDQQYTERFLAAFWTSSIWRTYEIPGIGACIVGGHMRRLS
jgi:hypothetical protein